MLSKVFITKEIDDLNLAVEELVNGVLNGIKLRKNSCGLLFCGPDMEQGELAKLLSQEISFDIIGCTTVATLDMKDGFQDMEISLVVLTSDHCEFSLTMSDKIDSSNVTREIAAAYRNCLEGLTVKPKLIFAIPPYNTDTMLDVYLDALDEISGGIPVIGGLPTHNDVDMGDRNLTIYNEHTCGDRMVMLAISGDIKPVFSVSNITGYPIERRRKITKAKDNTVYRVGNQTFTEYLAEIGLDLAKQIKYNNTSVFISNPILLEHVNLEEEDGDEFSFVRTLVQISMEDGSGTSIARIPEGATLSICTLRKDEIEQSAEKGMQELLEKIKQNESEDYKYSTVLAISCMGRYLMMSPKKSVEVDKLREMLPVDYSLGGFYSHGELGPLAGKKSGLINFAHNLSLVLCAF